MFFDWLQPPSRPIEPWDRIKGVIVTQDVLTGPLHDRQSAARERRQPKRHANSLALALNGLIPGDEFVKLALKPRECC